MAVAIIAIMGTIFALVEIALGPLTGLTNTQLGITAGASLHEIAHAVAAGDAFGAVDIATIMKLSRVLMLVFAAIIIAIWWDKNHSQMPSDGKRKISFPWFMLGFIGASIIGTFVPFIATITPQLVDFAYIVLGMAMAALGITVNFSALAKKGQKAFLASLITSIPAHVLRSGSGSAVLLKIFYISFRYLPNTVGAVRWDNQCTAHFFLFALKVIWY